MDQKLLNDVNAVLADLGLNATSPVTGTATEPESTVTGYVEVGSSAPNGAQSVTIYRSDGGSPNPLTLTFASGSPLLTQGAHTLVYFSAAAQTAAGVQDANDKLISVDGAAV